MEIVNIASSEEVLYLKKYGSESGFVFNLNKDSNLTAVIFVTVNADFDVKLNLKGLYSRADIYILVKLETDERVNISTSQNHSSTGTSSKLYVKSLLSGKSYLNFTGLIRIEKNTRQTDAYQRNENLILSENAKVQSKPALEILANDVRCTHGAVISPPDKQQMLYLRSRGIDKTQAIQLVSEGFLRDFTEHIDNKIIAGKVLHQISRWL